MKRFLAIPPVKFIVEIVELYFGKRVPQSAAALSYYLILTFFPVLICINAFVGLLDFDVNLVILAAEPFLPADGLDLLRDYLSYITENHSPALLTAGLSVTIFSAASAFRTLMSTMEELYDRSGYTGVWKIIASVVFSVVLLAIVYGSIVVLITGKWIFHLATEFFHLDATALPWDWQWLRFLLLFALVLLFVLVVYRISAPRGKPRPPVFTGALLASAALVLSSMVFSWSIGMFSRYSMVYGSLASIIILLAWLSLCGNILMLGNVFNCVWYRHKKIRYLKKLKHDSSPPESLGG